MPHLSIIIPTYNSERTLEECLRSIRNSEYKDYEIIIVDGKSRDRTCSIAKKYADKVIGVEDDRGRSHARNIGIDALSGEIIVFTDADNLIKHDTLTKISDFLSRHREVDAVTGLIAKEHPNQDFFSQYKNLYMNYIFKKLPDRVTFLHGSIYALRRHVAETGSVDIKTDDTERGQMLFF